MRVAVLDYSLCIKALKVKVKVKVNVLVLGLGLMLILTTLQLSLKCMIDEYNLCRGIF